MGNYKAMSLTNPNLDKFVDINTLKVGYWEGRAVDRLRQSFDRLKEAREMMLSIKPNTPLDPELEESFQAAGALILETAKALRPKPEPEEK